MSNEDAVTERGTFENQFNRKMNELIKAIDNPKKMSLRDVIERLEDMNVQQRTEWINRIIQEFPEDVTMQTLLEVQRRGGRKYV